MFTLTRIEFLRSLGLGGAALFTLLTACQSTDVNPGVITNGPVDFTLDLLSPLNNALRTNGGFVVSNGVVVARTPWGFVAASHICSHQQQPAIEFDKDRFTCTAHGAQFDLTGRGLNSLGKNGLSIYKTEQTGATLRVYS